MYPTWSDGSVPHGFFPAQMPLRQFPTGGFPVTEGVSVEHLPPSVKASILRLLEAPPKPAVTLSVMEEAQRSMIAPDLPFRTTVSGL